MNYRNGRKVSPSVFQAIRYVAKVGVITRETWNEIFGKGSIRWKQMQLKFLIDEGVFKTHPCNNLSDAFVMGHIGMEMAKEEKWKPVYFIQPQFIKHDETVGKGLWLLERHKLCKGWMTERELKGQSSPTFKLNVRELGGKYPDGVFKLIGNTSSAILALEYEKSGKTNWRYNKTIKAYSESGEFQYILYIVESPAIETSIRRGMRYIGDSRLNSRLGFIDAEDWKSNPLFAQIRGLSLAKTINELARKI